MGGAPGIHGEEGEEDVHIDYYATDPRRDGGVVEKS
jgi:hypothetical protein